MSEARRDVADAVQRALKALHETGGSRRDAQILVRLHRSLRSEGREPDAESGWQGLADLLSWFPEVPEYGLTGKLLMDEEPVYRSSYVPADVIEGLRALPGTPSDSPAECHPDCACNDGRAPIRRTSDSPTDTSDLREAFMAGYRSMNRSMFIGTGAAFEEWLAARGTE